MNTSIPSHTTRSANGSVQRRWTLALLAGAAAVTLLTTHVTAQAQAQAQAQAASTAVKITVNGMVCAFCAQGIAARLTQMPETADLYINLKQKVVAVQPKPGATLALDKIRAEVADAGYEVSSIEPMTQTVAQLREQLRAKK
ncbi:MAG: heavy-metal-associated domain-containing protein [Rubrivivax sp.]